MQYPHLRKIIDNFMSAKAKVRYYNSGVDGTLCVEWFEGGRGHSATVVDLARRIHRYKKEVIARENRIAAHS